jgi:predicted component of type VI protein secretion system
MAFTNVAVSAPGSGHLVGAGACTNAIDLLQHRIDDQHLRSWAGWQAARRRSRMADQELVEQLGAALSVIEYTK